MNLTQCSLFKGLNSNQISALLKELRAYHQKYQKNEMLVQAAQRAAHLGVLLHGTLHILRPDYEGNSILLSEIKENELFLETFALADEPLHVNVFAQSDCEVLWIPVHQIFSNPMSSLFMMNLVGAMAQKNLFLAKRINHLSKRKAEDKILSYLYDLKAEKQSCTFSIPLNRQQMADYLGMDRSALSFVLAKLKKKKILDFHKNQFTLIS